MLFSSDGAEDLIVVEVRLINELRHCAQRSYMMRPFRALSAHGHTSCTIGHAGMDLLLVFDAPVLAHCLHMSFRNVMEQGHLNTESC